MINRHLFEIEAFRRDTHEAVGVRFSGLLACTFGIAVAGHAAAGVVISNNFDEWSAQTGSFTTIDFIGLEHGTPLTSQYEVFGVTFTNSKAWSSMGLFPQDGFGMKELDINDPAPQIYFATPITAVAFHKTPATNAFLFYLGDEVISGPLNLGGGFVGLTFESPIDRIVVSGGLGTISIDNIYFGAPIPAPGVLVVAAIAGLLPVRRRRRG